MADRLLVKADRLFSQKSFSALIELLEPEIFRYREEEAFYRLLGLAYFYQGDWKGVDTYLQRYRQLTSTEEPNILLVLALAAIKRKDFQEATKLFLRILDDHPGNRRAQRGLKALHKALSRENSSVDLRTKTWTKVFPPLQGFKHPRTKLLGIFVLIAALGTMGAASFFWWRFAQDQDFFFFQPSQHRPGPKQILSQETQTQNEGLWKVTLKETEARETYKKIQQFFQEYRDSLARIEINRLLLSNASPSMKEKARAFIPFLSDPEFVSFRDSVLYAQVKEFPELYEGCAVKWKGVVANLKNEQFQVTFDLLLGYEQGQVVEAVLPVQLFFPVLLQNSQAIELLAVIEQDSLIKLRGISLRNLGYRP